MSSLPREPLLLRAQRLNQVNRLAKSKLQELNRRKVGVQKCNQPSDPSLKLSDWSGKDRSMHTTATFGLCVQVTRE